MIWRLGLCSFHSCSNSGLVSPWGLETLTHSARLSAERSMSGARPFISANIQFDVKASRKCPPVQGTEFNTMKHQNRHQKKAGHG